MRERYELTVNGTRRTVEAHPDEPLLWALRDALGLTGTKFGCGIGMCGACTVHVDGEAVRSCLMPVSRIGDGEVVTIEGLDTPEGRALQRAWVEEDVPQCGYCQTGQIMEAAALLRETPEPDDDAIDTAMRGVACRCGTYQRIRSAIRAAAGSAREAR